MIIFFSIVHVLLCVFMVLVILLQPGKDAGMGAALGGGAATSAFGGRGAVTFLGKVTAVCACAFFLTSLGLSMKDLRQSVTATAPPPAAKPADKPAADKAAADADKGSADPGATDKAAPAEGQADKPKEPGAAAGGGAVKDVAKTAAPPQAGDTVQGGSDKPGQPLPPRGDKPTGNEAIPGEKLPAK